MANDPKLEDNKQLELVGGEIVATDGQRPKYYLSAAANHSELRLRNPCV